MLAYSLTTPPPVAAMFLRAPVRMPTPRQLVEAEAHRLIDVLDEMEPDPDLEPSADPEPSLCGAGSHIGGALNGLFPSTASGDDREGDDADEPELENEHGGAVDDEGEYSLGSLCGTATGCTAMSQGQWSQGMIFDLETEHDGREDGGDDEPSLCGTTVSSGSWDDREGDTCDLEPSLGSLDGQEDQRRWGCSSRSDREHDEAERGVADTGGACEQIVRFIAAGGDMNAFDRRQGRFA